MLKKNVKSKVEKLLSKKFEEEGYQSLFLIDITSNEKSGLIRVYLDGDEGVKFTDCQQLSRYLEGFLDEDEEVDEVYTLEISSPGVKRPIQQIRQLPQHVGRTLRITWDDGQSNDWKLLKVGEIKFQAEQILSKKAKKNKLKAELQEIALEDCKEVIVKISFN